MSIVIKDDFKNLLPALADEQRRGLEKDILAKGCLSPLIIWNGVLLDGHNRYEICEKYNIEYQTRNMEFADETAAKVWIFTHQANRRNLTVYERAKIALQFETYFRERACENQSAGVCQNSDKGIDTKKELAKLADTSHDTLARVHAIEKRASAEIKQKLENQDISVNRAYLDLRREEKLKAVEEKIEKSKPRVLNAGVVDIYTIDRKYNVIYADPPWIYSCGGNCAAELHYRTISVDDICRLPVPRISEKDCILFLWVTYPHLPDAFTVLKAWGFKYSTCAFCWIKKNKNGANFFGLGNWTRANSELCLIATKGSIIRLDKGISQIIETEIEEHSKKPARVRDLIVRLVGSLPRIELFARQRVDGWDRWGNEA